MKPIKKRFHRRAELGMMRLYLRDINHVIETLKGAGLDVTISDIHAEYDSMDELKAENGMEIYRLNITGKRPEFPYGEICLELSNKTDSYLEIDGDGHPLSSCWHNLRDHLTSIKQPWHIKVFAPAQLFPRFFTLCAISIFLRIFNQNASTILGATALVYGLVSSCYRRYPTVILERPHEHQSFWKRNGDKIIIGGVSMLLGSCMPALWKWIAGH